MNKTVEGVGREACARRTLRFGGIVSPGATLSLVGSSGSAGEKKPLKPRRTFGAAGELGGKASGERERNACIGQQQLRGEM